MFATLFRPKKSMVITPPKAKSNVVGTTQRQKLATTINRDLMVAALLRPVERVPAAEAEPKKIVGFDHLSCKKNTDCTPPQTFCNTRKGLCEAEKFLDPNDTKITRTQELKQVKWSMQSKRMAKEEEERRRAEKKAERLEWERQRVVEINEENQRKWEELQPELEQKELEQKELQRRKKQEQKEPADEAERKKTEGERENQAAARDQRRAVAAEAVAAAETAKAEMLKKQTQRLTTSSPVELRAELKDKKDKKKKEIEKNLDENDKKVGQLIARQEEAANVPPQSSPPLSPKEIVAQVDETDGRHRQLLGHKKLQSEQNTRQRLAARAAARAAAEEKAKQEAAAAAGKKTQKWTIPQISRDVLKLAPVLFQWMKDDGVNFGIGGKIVANQHVTNPHDVWKIYMNAKENRERKSERDAYKTLQEILIEKEDKVPSSRYASLKTHFNIQPDN